jgi:hypothetical protein
MTLTTTWPAPITPTVTPAPPLFKKALSLTANWTGLLPRRKNCSPSPPLPTETTRWRAPLGDPRPFATRIPAEPLAAT